MKKNKTPVDFSSPTKFFHWLIAVIVILMLSGGFFLEDIPKQYAGVAFMMHKSIGLSILALMILRLLWILHAGRPPLPGTVRPWERILSRIVQYGFYLFLILMPVSGWVMSVAAGRVPTFFGLFNVPMPWITPNEHFSNVMFSVHQVIAWTLIVLVVLHVSGALKHHFIDRDDVLRKMLPAKR